MNIHHLGYAVRDIGKAIPAFEALGFSVSSGVTDDTVRSVRIVFMQNGTERIELIAPLTTPSPVDAILAKIGAMPYHICYEVDSINAAAADLAKKGFKPVTRESAAPAIDGRPVVFLFHVAMGIIELVERKE